MASPSPDDRADGMSAISARIDGLPHALRDDEQLEQRLGGRGPAVFLDYDGTLTPIVDRPEDAVISESMRASVRGLAARCPVCVVSGRDRPVVQQLMGIDDLIVAGSHGFDIWSPAEGTLEHEAGGDFHSLIERVTARLQEEAAGIDGSLVEPKKASVALHYRLVADPERPKVRAIVDRLLAEHPDDLKVTPGKMVFEIQPKIDWDKGNAVLYLLRALDLDREGSCRSIWATTSPTRTPSRLSRAVASASLWAAPTIPRSPAVTRTRRSSSTRPRRWSDFWTRRHGDRSAPTPGERLALAYDELRARAGGTARGADLDRQRLLLHARGAEWEDADDVHYPGTYAHGGYNRETTILGGQPGPQRGSRQPPQLARAQAADRGRGGDRLDDVELLYYRHEFDVRTALVMRELRFRDRAGRETTLRSRRFVSMADMHQAGIEWTLTPENWSGRVEVVSALDGRVTNQGVARYRQLEGRHLDPVSRGRSGPDVIALKAQTRQSSLEVAEAARTRVYRGGEQVAVERSLYQMEDYIQQVLAFDVAEGDAGAGREAGRALHARATARSTSRWPTRARSAPAIPAFDEALERHAEAWDELWEVCDVRFPGDERAQFLLRLHISHILQVCSRHTADLDAGVPARGPQRRGVSRARLLGRALRLSFLNFRLPEITRGLLMYRYRRISEARAAAREAGYRGAMFPWQSGSDGKEETQRVHLNPLSGRWDPDLSRNQRHVNAAIFYNIWHYYQATQDLDFLRDYGAEMMLEIARFWASIAHYNPERDRYEIHGVMGPDEFHEKYPGADRGRPAQQRLHERDGGVDAATRRQVLGLLPASRARRAARPDRPHRRGDAAVAAR